MNAELVTSVALVWFRPCSVEISHVNITLVFVAYDIDTIQ